MKTRLALLAIMVVVGAAAVISAQEAMLDADYMNRAKALKADDSQGHFDLAKWAYKRGLYKETVAEADALLAIDSGDSRARFLKSAAQFWIAGGPVVNTSIAAVDTGAVVGPSSTAIAPPRRGGPANVINLSKEEADQVWQKYGNKSLGEFQRNIQGLFLRSCGTENCHGGEATAGAFYLKSQRSNDRITVAENFKAVDQFVNHNNLATSRILAVMLAGPQQHPARTAPIFNSDGDPTFKRIKQWIEGLPTSADLMWGP